jgi:phosphinothricin acetyltransferase
MEKIRLATPRDAREVHRIYAPIVQDTFISFEVEVPTQSEIEGRIASTLRKFPWLVAEDARGLLGYAYANEHRERLAYQWSVDVSCYVDERTRRRGVGSRLYHALFRILAAQGFTNAFAGVSLPNAASVGMHQSVGFDPLGYYRNVGFKRGEWRDTVWMQRVLSAPSPNPRAPVALASMPPDEIEAALRAA